MESARLWDEPPGPAFADFGGALGGRLRGQRYLTGMSEGMGLSQSLLKPNSPDLVWRNPPTAHTGIKVGESGLRSAVTGQGAQARPGGRGPASLPGPAPGRSSTPAPAASVLTPEGAAAFRKSSACGLGLNDDLVPGGLRGLRSPSRGLCLSLGTCVHLPDLSCQPGCLAGLPGSLIKTNARGHPCRPGG